MEITSYLVADPRMAKQSEGTEEHIYCYDRRALPRARPVEGLTVERVSGEAAKEYAKIAFASFTERGPPDGTFDFPQAIRD